MTGLALGREFSAWVEGTSRLPLERLLATHGIDMMLREAKGADDKGGVEKAADVKKDAANKDDAKKAADAAGRVSLGARVKADGKDIALTHVLEGGSAQEAGLSAGDVIVAIDGVRTSASSLEGLLSARKPGSVMKGHAFRRDEMFECEVRLKRAGSDTCYLAEAKARSPLLDRWLPPGRKPST